MEQDLIEQKGNARVKEMTSKDVLDLYTTLENLDIKIWIDGGWAVDALLGKQTRPHTDLDIAIEHKNLEKLKEYLELQGYTEVLRDEDKKWDLVMGDTKGHEIDVHAFSFDDKGRVIEEEDWAGYSRGSLSGFGTIRGYIVLCVSADHLIKTHDGAHRPLKENDYKDIAALCDKFKITYPEEYAHLKK